MPNGKNHGFGIPTRQKDDELFRRKADAGVIVSGETAEFPIRRVLGYGVIRFLVISDQPIRLRIEEASDPEGPWVETERLASIASTSGSGQQFICADISPCGTFMRIFLDNIGGSDSESSDLAGFGHPIAGGGGAGGGGGGAPASVVELEDGNAGITRASVKTDGTLVGAQGSVLVGGRDGAGAQQAFKVDENGNLLVATSDVSPGATITTAPDTTVGVAATVPLAVAPAGTRRVRVQITGGDDDTRVRIREVGGPAGSGVLLLNSSVGSTMYGGVDGAIAPLEAEHVAGTVAATVAVQFERD